MSRKDQRRAEAQRLPLPSGRSLIGVKARRMMASVVLLGCAGLAAAACGGGSLVNEQDGSVQGHVLLFSPVAGPQVCCSVSTSVKLIRHRQLVQMESIPPKGSFHFEVLPGTYSVEVTSYRGCSATRTVRAGEDKRVDIVCGSPSGPPFPGAVTEGQSEGMTGLVTGIS
jgi:hypothetical protein